MVWPEAAGESGGAHSRELRMPDGCVAAGDAESGQPQAVHPVRPDTRSMRRPASLPYLYSMRLSREGLGAEAAQRGGLRGNSAVGRQRSHVGVDQDQPLRPFTAMAAQPGAPMPILEPRLAPAERARAEAQWRALVRERRDEAQAAEAASAELRRVREATDHARAAFGSREYSRAAEHLSESLRLCPRSDVLLRMRAKAHARAGKLPSALHDGRAAAELNPRSADNQLLLSSLCLREGALADAGHALCDLMARDASAQRGEGEYRALLGSVRTKRTFWQAPMQRVVPRIFDTKVRHAAAVGLTRWPQPRELTRCVTARRMCRVLRCMPRAMPRAASRAGRAVRPGARQGGIHRAARTRGAAPADADAPLVQLDRRELGAARGRRRRRDL